MDDDMKDESSQALTMIKETQDHVEEEDSIQSLHEEELIDQNGDFIIFANSEDSLPNK